MNDEQQNKIYTSMAQAEDLQTHAQQLQKQAQDTFKELPLAVAQASKEIQRRGLIQALFVVAVGVMVAVIAWAVVYWITTNTRAEYSQIRQEVATLKTWGLELVEWEDERGIILPKGTKFIRDGEVKDGRKALVIRQVANFVV